MFPRRVRDKVSGEFDGRVGGGRTVSLFCFWSVCVRSLCVCLIGSVFGFVSTLELWVDLRKGLLLERLVWIERWKRAWEGWDCEVSPALTWRVVFSVFERLSYILSIICSICVFVSLDAWRERRN